MLGRAENSGDWDAVIDRPQAGVNRLLPLLDRAVRLHGLRVSARFGKHLRAASLREHSRAKVVSALCYEALRRLRDRDIPAIALKGIPAAETVYPEPELRHCHDLDLFTEPVHVPSAVAALGGAFESDAGARGIVLRHSSGFPICLHTALFRAAPFGAAIPSPFDQTWPAVIAGAETKILAPSAQLLQTLAHAAASGSRNAPGWVADAWFLVNRHGIDWTWIQERAVAGHMAGPVWVMLGFLARCFDIPVPAQVLDSLHAAVSGEEPAAKLAAQTCLLTSARGRPLDLVRIASNWTVRLTVTRWLLLPPPEYLRVSDGPAGAWRLPLRYLSRSARFLTQSFK